MSCKISKQIKVKYIILTSFDFPRFNTDCCENLFTQIKFIAGASNTRRIGSLQFQQILRDFLLGAGNHIPISKSAAVQETDSRYDPEPWLSAVGDMEPFLASVTEGLVEPTKEEDNLTVSLDTAMDEIIQEISDDQTALRSLSFTLPEEEGMKYFAGV